MPSTMTGLRKTLTWGNYGQPKAGAKPSSGVVVHAETEPKWNLFYQPEHVPGSNRTLFRIRNNVTMTVTLTPGPHTWVMRWVFAGTPTFQAQLLHHEQGHYDVGALIARDCFVDVILLLNQTFASQADLDNRVRQIKTDSVYKTEAVQKLYDADVHPEHLRNNYNGPKQREWDVMIRDAFTARSERNLTDPNGNPVMVRLIDRINRSGNRV